MLNYFCLWRYSGLNQVIVLSLWLTRADIHRMLRSVFNRAKNLVVSSESSRPIAAWRGAPIERNCMETRIDEIASGVYRLSIFVPETAPPAGFTYNHFLITGDEPLLFHCGKRKMFPLVSTASPEGFEPTPDMERTILPPTSNSVRVAVLPDRT